MHDLTQLDSNWIMENAHHLMSPAEAERYKEALAHGSHFDPAVATKMNRNSSEAAAGGAILRDLCQHIRRFVVLTDAQLIALGLWVVHTHAFDAASATPYLNISSAEKQSGKTRLLETLETLVHRPWFTGRTTVGALVRKIAKDKSTLLLDETDAAFGGDKIYTETLRSILNSGYKLGGVSTFCVGQGSNQEAKDHQVFSPKAFAGIGDRLPDTVKDRSISIRLKRRSADERVEKFRSRDARAEAGPLIERIQQWTSANLDSLKASRPMFPKNVSDRAEEVWEALLALADAAGGEWPDTARRAMTELCMSEDADDDSTGVRLLADIRQIFDELLQDDSTQERIASVGLVQRLVDREESPWSEWLKGRPISTRVLLRS